MRARLTNDEIWYCDNCEMYHAEIEEVTLYYHYDAESVRTPDTDDGYQYFTEGAASEVWWYCQGCSEYVSKEKPQTDTAWQCSKCGNYFPNKQEADECCT